MKAVENSLSRWTSPSYIKTLPMKQAIGAGALGQPAGKRRQKEIISETSVMHRTAGGAGPVPRPIYALRVVGGLRRGPWEDKRNC